MRERSLEESLLTSYDLHGRDLGWEFFLGEIPHPLLPGSLSKDEW
jgi:hypothetical protein